jgi:hypothetical protein
MGGSGAWQNPGTAAAVTAQPPGAAPTGDLLTDNGLWQGAPAGSGCAVCGGGDCNPPDWYTEQGLRILTRSRARGIIIGYDYDASGTVPVEALTSRSVSPGIAPMWEMTLGHYFARDAHNRDHFVELSFWGLGNWTGHGDVIGRRFTSSNTNTGWTTSFGSLESAYRYVPNGAALWGFNYADRQSIAYKSSMNNFEINGRFTQRNGPDRRVMQPESGRWRTECQPGMTMSYLYGLRLMQVNETFGFHSESNVSVHDGTTLISSHDYEGNYDIGSRNNLVGLQIGAEMIFHDCRWSWGIRSKLGPYVNFADQESNIEAGLVGDPSYVRRVAASKHNAAFIGEVGFEATYKFRPNLVGRAAYDFLWATGLALGPEQLQFVAEPLNKVNTNGLIFMQGITLALEWLW